MSVLLTVAMEKEAKGIIERLQLEKIEENMYQKENITLLLTGIGKQTTMFQLVKYLENHIRPDKIVNIGYAGSTNIPIGTWVQIENVYNYEWNILEEQKYTIEGYPNREMLMLKELPKYPCYTAESFVTQTDIKENSVFDMELHSVYLVSCMYSIDLISIKLISDNLCLEDYYKNIERNEMKSIDSSIEILKANKII